MAAIVSTVNASALPFQCSGAGTWITDDPTSNVSLPHYSQSTDCYLTYTFSGSGVAVMGIYNARHGLYSCSVADGPATVTTPAIFNANAASASISEEILCQVQGLTAGNHTVTVRPVLPEYFVSISSVKALQSGEFIGGVDDVWTGTRPQYGIPAGYSFGINGNNLTAKGPTASAVTQISSASSTTSGAASSATSGSSTGAIKSVSSGMSAGAGAGIAIAALLGVELVLAALWFFCWRRRGRSSSSTRSYDDHMSSVRVDPHSRTRQWSLSPKSDLTSPHSTNNPWNGVAEPMPHTRKVSNATLGAASTLAPGSNLESPSLFAPRN